MGILAFQSLQQHPARRIYDFDEKSAAQTRELACLKTARAF